MLLAAKGLWKMLGDRWVLRGIDLELYEGEAVLVVGHNGSGKTTLLRVLAGLTEPSGGSVWRACSRCVAMVGHAPMLYPELTVRENLEFYADIYGALLEEFMGSDEWAMLGLERYLDVKVKNLSFGWSRRADIARALLARPRIILLDEAFTGLDSEALEAIHSIIAGAKGRGCGILLTSPRPGDEYLTVADRVYILVDGRLRVYGEWNQS